MSPHARSLAPLVRTRGLRDDALWCERRRVGQPRFGLRKRWASPPKLGSAKRELANSPCLDLARPELDNHETMPRAGNIDIQAQHISEGLRTLHDLLDKPVAHEALDLTKNAEIYREAWQLLKEEERLT